MSKGRPPNKKAFDCCSTYHTKLVLRAAIIVLIWYVLTYFFEVEERWLLLVGVYLVESNIADFFGERKSLPAGSLKDSMSPEVYMRFYYPFMNGTVFLIGCSIVFLIVSK